MTVRGKIKFAYALYAVILTVIAVLDMAYGAEPTRLKIEVTTDRAVISCVNGSDPIMRTAPRPKGGYYAVVICE
jgi:hypothetical protein